LHDGNIHLRHLHDRLPAGSISKPFTISTGFFTISMATPP
jgi:hypothetical protein